MPQQTESNRLQDSIQAYSTVLLDLNSSGHLKICRQGDDPLAKMCHEIKHTRLARRMTFHSDAAPLIEMSVRNGRVFAVHIHGPGNPPIDCAAGTADDAETVFRAMQSVVSNCASLWVSYDRCLKESDGNGSGVAPDAILSLHQKTATSDTASDETEGIAAIFPEGSAIGRTAGTDDGIARLQRILAASANDPEGWIEKLNDDLIEEVELGTGSGTKLSLNYSLDGVRMTLF